MSTKRRTPEISFRQRGCEIFLINTLIFLELSNFVLAWQSWPACPSAKMIRVKVDYQSSRCCHDITCRAGFEPKVCTKDDPNPSCAKCSDGTYQPKPSMLSHPQWNKCRRKTNCEVRGMKYRSFGNTSVNSICECTSGYFCDNDMCLPKGRCPVGYGRDAKTDDCLPCALGKTYSDVEHVSEPCKKVTRCSVLDLRTVKPATVQSDSICGNRTATDGGDNGGIPPLPTIKAKDEVVTIKSPENDNETGGSSDLSVDPGLGTVPILQETNESDDSTKHHQVTQSLVGWVGGT
ncbi:tumor necrosis factor receptor superfamily member 11B-like [Lineus longissimus]|uniref:tumor necrosis factor receptor superfamily member 11B-like n=1 Tax=Lineus longissimus TaxID=88925 RepID=UPI002B4D85AE